MDVQPIGSKHFSSSVSGVVQIINPADNVSGVIIRTSSMQALSWTIVSTGATKPKDAYDFSSSVLMAAVGNTSKEQQYPISLPAGFGLWAASAGSAATLFLTYDLLP